MSQPKYSSNNPLAAFGFLINAMDQQRRPPGPHGMDDGDRGMSFPRSDAEDLSRGARFIPGEVTDARRAGQHVYFETECGPNCWYWKMPDGTRIFHYDPETYQQIGLSQGLVWSESQRSFDQEVGPCPKCGNPHTGGGRH